MSLKTAQTIRRRMYTERLILRRPGNQAIMTAVVHGHIDSNLIRSAMMALNEKYPLLSAHIVIDKDGSAWFVVDHTTGPEIVSVMKESEDQWLDVVAQEHKQYLDTESGPLARIVLIQGEEDSEIIVNCHHSICDGLSLVYFIKDLLSCMGECNDEFHNTSLGPHVNSETVSSNIRDGLASRAIIRLVNWIWKRHSFGTSQAQFKQLDEIYWHGKNPYVMAWKLESEDVEKLLTRCKREGVTVHSALCAAFLSAQDHIERTNDKHARCIHIPVDIRNRLNVTVGDAFGFYAAPIIVKFPYFSKKSFWDITRVVHAKIKKHLTNKKVLKLVRINSINPLLIDSLYFAKFDIINSRISSIVGRSIGLNKPVAALAITNLGKLTIPTSYGKLRLMSIFGPTVFSDLLDKVLGVTTIGNTMNFTVIFDANITEPSTIERIRDTAMTLLKESIIA